MSSLLDRFKAADEPLPAEQARRHRDITMLEVHQPPTEIAIPPVPDLVPGKH